MNGADLESAARAAFLEYERWKTVQLMGVVDKLYSERLVLVRHITHYERVWMARTGRIAMFARERARVNELDVRISSAQLMIYQRQEELHPIQPQQQHPRSSRREPTLVDPVEAGGMSIAGVKQQRQQLEQQPQHAKKLWEEESEKRGSGYGERGQAEELDVKSASRSGNSDAEDGKENPGVPLPHPIESVSPIQPACWVGPDAQVEQEVSSVRFVETHPTVARIAPPYENRLDRLVEGEERNEGEGTGQLLGSTQLPPLPPPPQPPPPGPTSAVDSSADQETEERNAVLVASRLVLAQQALVSYEKRQEEAERQREEEEEEAEEEADGVDEQPQRQEPEISCRTARGLGPHPCNPQDGDAQRGRIQSGTTGDQQRQGQQHHLQHDGGEVKMMQAVWGEAWWRKKKRKMQDDLEGKRRREYEDRMADSTRLEAMRQRRIKRKMGACAYHCWPCGRAEYDKMFPKSQIPVIDPALEEAERLRKAAEAKAALQREMEERYLNPQTHEYKMYREKLDAKKAKEKKQLDKKAPPAGRRPEKREKRADDRRLRLEGRRARNGRSAVAGGAFDGN